jgi:hypothetical protein
MEFIDFGASGYKLAVDYYPYDETRKILKQTSFWWDHVTKIKDPEKASNYALDESLINSIEYSLAHRMNNGFFNFLYYNDEVFSYGGLRIDSMNQAWLHRGASHPVLGKNHIGAAAAFLMPYQAKQAKLKGCTTYNLSFNQVNYKFYVYYRDKHYYRSKKDVHGGEKFMDSFEYRGKIFVMNQEQFVATLDLTKPGIDEILMTI